MSEHSERYRVKMIDSAHAIISMEHGKETQTQAIDRVFRGRRYMMTGSAEPSRPADIVLIDVWTYRIQIGTTALFAGEVGGFRERRHALAHAWKRLTDEGIMPGATLEKELEACSCAEGPALVSGDYCGRCGKAPRRGIFRRD